MVEKGRLETVAVVLLLALIPLFTLASNARMYATADEPSYIFQGFVMARHPELPYTYGRGYLTDRIAGLQFYVRDIPIPEGFAEEVARRGIVVAPLLFFDRLPEILFWARLPFTIIAVIFGLCVFLFAKELFGKKAGLLALLLFVFEPNLIGYASFVSSDFLFAFFTLLIVWALYRYMKSPSLALAASVGALLGLAMLTKFTALYFGPIIIALYVAYHHSRIFSREALWHGIAVGGVFWLVLCAGFGFGGVFTPLGASIAHENLTVPIALPSLVLRLPPLLPYDFVKSFVYQSMGVPAATFLVPAADHGTMYPYMGGFATVWYYYILCFIVKTPIPLLLLLFIVCLAYPQVRKRDDRALIVPIIGFYVVFTLLNSRQLGYRFMLECIPLIIIFASKVVHARFFASRVVVAMLCIWFVVCSVLAFPFYLSYFSINQQGAYKDWAGSNIDEGQDLYRLYDDLAERKINKFKLAYFGYPTALNDYSGRRVELPQMRGKEYEEFCGPTSGLIAISVTELGIDRACYGWLRLRTPSWRIGYSILLYNVSDRNAEETQT